jgi:hypothetical protein
MDDIVDRLRLIAEHDWRTSILAHTPTAAEAAAEILSLRARVERLEAALRGLMPHLKLSHEPTVSDCVSHSRGEQLRMEADETDRYDAAIRDARAALEGR